MFPTIRFAVFFAVVWGVLIAVRGNRRRWRLSLLTANWVFYLTWNRGLFAVLLVSILANHLLVRLVARNRGRSKRNPWLIAGIVANLGPLGYFKYYDFFATSFANTLARAGVSTHPPLVDIVLPLGLSFFTFQAISYLVEIEWNTVRAAPLVDEAIWLSFFPIVISGPITRASEFFPQLASAHKSSAVEAHEAFLLVVRGLVKKVVIASFLSVALVDNVFADPQSYSSIEVLTAIYAYAALLYADFSGYSDMARGLGLLIGVRLPENFASPYVSTSVTQFWSRWHMTLSRWIRDYVFYPLGKRAGARRGATYRNLVVVMVLVGLWHGAAWTFVAFGLVHGIALAVARYRRDVSRDRLRHRRADAQLSAREVSVSAHGRARAARRWAITFHTVCLGWVFFRAASLGAAGRVLLRLGSLTVSVHALSARLVIVTAGVVLAQLAPSRLWDASVDRFARLSPVSQTALLAGSLMVIDVLGPQGVPPFIYFRF